MRISKVLVVFVCACFSASAVAGLHSNNPVLVTLNGATSSFSGNIGQAYNSASNSEYIQCTIETYSSGATATLGCDALDQWGGSGSCTSGNPSLVTAARAIADGDFLRVEFNDLTGICTTIRIHKGSKGEPKQ